MVLVSNRAFRFPAITYSYIPKGYTCLVNGPDMQLVRIPEEEPMIPTRREVWAEIKDRIDVCQNVARPPYTMVEVGTVYNGHLYSGFGFAKQNRYGPTADEWNEKEGFNHAYGRAKQNLLDTIMASLKGAA